MADTADDTPDTSAMGSAVADANGVNTPMGSAASLASGNPNAQYLIRRAKEEGIDPLDLATVMHYESGNNPSKWGGKDGKYGGLIQFGPEERKTYGIDPASTPYNDQVDASLKFLKDRGFNPRKHGLLDMYSTVNSGSPGNYGASDGNGTVASHVQNMMGDARGAASKFLSSANDPSWKPPQPVLAQGDNTASDASNTPMLQAQAQAPTTTSPAPLTDLQKMNGLGNSLTSLGAALMARDNPNGAAALRAALPAQVTPTKTSLSDIGFKKLGNGQWVHSTYNAQTGQYINTPVNKSYVPQSDIDESNDTSKEDALKQRKDIADAKIQESQQKDLLKAQKPFQDNDAAMTRASMINDDINMIRQKVISGQLKLGNYDQSKSWIDNFLNQTDDNDADVKNAFARIKQATLQNIKDYEKGATSRAQLQAAQEANLPAGGQFSTRTLLDSLDRTSEANRAAYETRARANGTLIKSFPKLGDTGQIDPETGQPLTSEGMQQRWNDKLKQYHDFEKQYGKDSKARSDFIKSYQSGGTPTPGQGSFFKHVMGQ